ncbi:N-acetylmuramoyl-L-alanine amidase [Hyphomicrobium denitrificans 1NES1]|uniref:N-acetylmuramoyl-L-alanine amidase n=1 Tax=Hyphomicrobium denitrificans 1NES1 TaxID=670307 RepID=N0BAR6_9HYPH|nr:N-acetylmuramoyl-L-alanine amidase [Hyphomicrobium denitrificans 1NES1]
MLGLMLALGVGRAQALPDRGVEATAVRLFDDGKATTFELTISKGLTAQVYTLANPYRVVLDLPDMTFHLDAAAGKKGRGVISAFRYGLFAEHKARVVLDTTGPVRIASAGMTRVPGSKALKLAVVLVPMDAAAFGGGTGATLAAASPSDLGSDMAPPESADRKHKDNAKPVIVIDPGHGGIDPGALGANNVAEKWVVLAVALQLKAALAKTRRYDVRMTRTDDVFVSLDRRLKFSAENDADLFISLHADSIEEKSIADSIRGATIYTLSDKASDEQARLMADKENASDLIAGVGSMNQEGGEEVKNILIDLLKRETSNFSADFSHVLAKKLGQAITMSRIPRKSAAFKVLKQTHAPSVLVELGYMSNSAEEQEMMTGAWQYKVAEAITSAVQSYFSKRTVAQP